MTIYYNKQTMKLTQTKSEDTIPMNDKSMADYRHYAGNQHVKSLELIQEVGQVPYLEYYELDEDGNRYSHYLDELVDGRYVPDLEAIQSEQEANELATKISDVKVAKELALNSITVEVNGNIFDGRAKDQVNIMGAIQSAEILGETSTEWKLADNSLYEVTVDELKMVLALAMQEVGKIVKG